ncbi:MAG TPA: hypothetical protein VIC31_07865 [Rudaea sp.]
MFFATMPAHAEDDDTPPVMTPEAYAAAAATPPVFKTTKEDHHGTLASLRNAVVPKNTNTKRVNFEGLLPLPPGSTTQSDGALQTSAGPTLNAPTSILDFDGVGAGFTGPSGTFSVQYIPPDTDGAVGATQYVSIVNTDFAIFDKTTGNAVYGPVPINTLWSGFGGGCQTNNDGDAVVIYDRAANRWVISQFSVNTTPYLQCVAVSQTSDATLGWNLYSFSYGSTLFPDYPKMGAWPDAYYETFNMFNGNTPSANLCAYNRAAMLTGAAATQQCFQLSTAYTGVLPSDLDGSTAPPPGSPNFLINYGTNKLNLWKFHVDWATPANSTLTGPTSITVPAFSPVCAGGTCITQPGTTQKLDSLADRMMFRLAYRNFGSYESLVASHSVVAGSKGGVRWYELRSPNGTPTVFQASTYAPDTTAYRWLPSIAMDQAGDIALGYSVSTGTAPTIFPSVRYTGRLATDPINTMQSEVTLFSGSGSQIGTCGSPPRACTRWGDYSAMTVDPVDDCTFWYTNEYIPANGLFNWKTRIGNFKFPSCVAKQNQTITFTSTAPAGATVGGATYTVTATASSGLTVTLTIDASASSVCSISGSTVSFTDVGNCVIDANQAGNGTYNAAPQAQQTFAVGKGNQTITFTSTAPAAATVGGSTYTVTATSSAGLTPVTFTIDASASSVCSISGSTVSFTGVGNCVIDANQAGNASYNAAPQVQQTFAVGKGNQTITFTSTAPAGAVVGGPAYTVTATSSAGLTPVTFTIDASASSVCSISGSTVSFTGVGNCVIDANQAGNGTYNAAPQVQQTFAVAPGAPSQLILSSVPDGTAGVALAPAVTVTVEDASGNVVVGDTGSVTLSITSGPGAFDGASTVTVSFSNGVATFSNLILDTAGNYTLSASDGSDSLNAGPSNSFNIVAAAPDHLAFTPVPGDIVQGQTLGTVTVTEYDAFGNQVTSDSATQIALVAGSCGGTVLGTQALNGGAVAFNTTQSFMTAASGVNLSAAASASPPTAAASTFNVMANSDLVFFNGFESCAP